MVLKSKILLFDKKMLFFFGQINDLHPPVFVVYKYINSIN
jgi:hypothetical protein